MVRAIAAFALCLVVASASALSDDHVPIEVRAHEVAYWGTEIEQQKCPLLYVIESTSERITKIVPSGIRLYRVRTYLGPDTPWLSISVRNPNFRLMGEECGELVMTDVGITGELSDATNGMCYERDKNPLTKRELDILSDEEFKERARADYVDATWGLYEIFRQCDKLAAGKEHEPDTD